MEGGREGDRREVGKGREKGGREGRREGEGRGGKEGGPEEERRREKSTDQKKCYCFVPYRNTEGARVKKHKGNRYSKQHL